MTGIPHRCPWCSERCNCGTEPAAIEECTHDCDAIDDAEEYTAADITDDPGPCAWCSCLPCMCGGNLYGTVAVPDEFETDEQCDFTDGDIIT